MSASNRWVILHYGTSTLRAPNVRRVYSTREDSYSTELSARAELDICLTNLIAELELAQSENKTRLAELMNEAASTWGLKSPTANLAHHTTTNQNQEGQGGG